MKIKNAWIVLAVTLMIALPTRIYQVLFLVEPDTGFYTDGNTTTTIISISLAAGALLMMAIGMMDKRERTYSPITSIPTAVIGAVTGLGIIVQYTVSFFAVEQQKNTIPTVILSILGILAGAVMILTAYNFATGQNIFAKIPLLSLIPSLWGCVCLITLFITYVSVVNISENIYDTFTVIFLLLFLFAQAKMLAGIETEKSAKRIYIFGLPAVLMALATGVPSAILLFSGASRTGSFPMGLHLVNILMALYIIAFLTAVSRFPVMPEKQGNSVGAAQLKPGAPGHQNTAESTARPAQASQGENCIEFLREAYRSEEKFAKREKSPFIQHPNKNC
jgi:hypothetical protein